MKINSLQNERVSKYNAGIFPAKNSPNTSRIRKYSAIALLALAGTSLSTPVFASPPFLAGKYIKIGVNGSTGTLGSGGNNPPGILYDGTGTGTFNPSYDYLTPGSPFEGFTLSGTKGGSAFQANANNDSSYHLAGGGQWTSTGLADYSGVAHGGSTYDQRMVWTGTYQSGGVDFFKITNDYFFNVDGQQLNIVTTVEALTDLTGLNFARYTDPDARAAAGDSSATKNFIGASGVAASDIVYAEALVSKYVIGLFTTDSTTHKAAVTSWTQNPALYVAGGQVRAQGDDTIGLGFNLGNLLSGSSLSIGYKYIFGTNIAAAVGAAGGGSGGVAVKPNIDLAKPYGVNDLNSGAVNPVFEGGTLTLNSGGAVNSNFSVTKAGGAIDTADNDLAASGKFAGEGVVEKKGGGVLTVTGENTHGGFNVQGGTLAFNGDAALGAPTAPVILGGGGTLRPLGDLTLDRGVLIDAGETGGFDTAGHTVTLGGVVSGGALVKQGGGTLVLTGANSQSGLQVGGGQVVVGQAGALGAPGGQVVLNGGNLAFGQNMSIGQSLNVSGAGGGFDTAGHDVVLTGAVSGDACLIKTGAGHLSLNAAGGNAIGACVRQGQLSFNNVFNGRVWVDPTGMASGGGRVNGDVEVSGVLAPGNSPGRLEVAGNLVQNAGSTLALDIDGLTPGVGAGHYDTLVISGTYTAGGTIAPTLRGISGSATNSFTPKIGDAFQVVSAEGGVGGTYASLTQPAAGLAANSRFEVVYLPKAVVLAVTPDSYRKLGGRGNAGAFGAAADRLRPAAGSPVGSAGAALAGGLAGLNEAQLVRVMHQASGELHASALDSTLAGGQSLRAQIAGRFGDGFSGERHLWGDAGRQNWKLKADGRAMGYDAERSTVVFGVDRTFSSSLLAGVAVSYGENDIDGAVGGRANAVSYQAHAYGAWLTGDYYVQGVVSGGVDTYKVNRRVDLSTGARLYSSKVDGSSLSADVEAGRKFAYGPATWTLAAGLSGDRAKRDGVRETGDAAAALAIAEADRTSIQARVGGKVEGQVELAGATLKPQASVFVMQELGDKSSRLDVTLQGQRFAIDAADPGATAVELSTGVSGQIGQRGRLGLGYGYRWSDKAQSHALNAVVSIRW